MYQTTGKNGKLIKLGHICQPANFSLATALKAWNTKAISTRPLCSYYLDLSLIHAAIFYFQNGDKELQ